MNTVLDRIEAEALDPARELELLRSARDASQAVTEARDANFGERAARVEYRIAELLRAEGKLASAEAGLSAALERWGATAPFHRALLRLVRAQLLRRMGRSEDALESLSKLEQDLASSVFQDYGDFALVLQVNLHGERAQVWRDLGVVELAARALEQERAAAQASGQPQLVVAWRLHRASLDLVVENFSRAVEEMQEVLSRAESSELPAALRAKARMLLGCALSEVEREHPGREARATRVLEGALQASELTGNDRLNVLLTLADLALRQRDAARAQRWLEAARQLVENWPRGEGEHFPFQEGTLLSVHRARLALLGGAQEVLEERLAEMRVAFDAFLGAWANTPLRPGGVGFLHSGDRRLVLEILARTTLAVEGQERGLPAVVELLLDAQCMGTLARRLRVEEATLAGVRSELVGRGELILLYLPSMDSSLLFVIDGEGLELHELPPRDSLRRAASEHFFALARTTRASSDDSVIEAQARGLELVAQLLPAQVQARLAQAARVTVVGAELLGGVHFEALPLAGGALLGEAVALDHLPSLPVGLLLARRPLWPAQRDLLLASALEPDPEARVRWPALESLPWDARREELLTRGLGERRVTLLREATREGLERAGPRDFAVVHLLAHGVSDPARERGAGLLLASEGVPEDSGVLWCTDVEQLKWNGLTILSVCGAAAGPERRGDDKLADLGGAFLSAGASAVVLSSERVAYESTLELMGAFHRRLAAGERCAEALRAARASLAHDAGAAARYQAASFRLVGLGGRAPIAREPRGELARSELPRPADRGTRSGDSGLARKALCGAVALAVMVGLWGLTRRRHP